MRIHTEEIPEITDNLEQAGLDISYSKRAARYHLKFSNIEEFIKNKETILQLVDNAKERMSAE